jgi:Rnl2 family RNA ligase
MDDFHKYPELVTLDKRPEMLAVRQAIATEKLHGSNFRVFFPDGITSPEEIRFGSRNEIFEVGDTGFHGGRPSAFFRANAPMVAKLIEVFASYGFSGGVVVYGEICGTSVQKGIKYAGDGEVIFRAFDIRVAGNFVTYDLFVELCEKTGLPRVPEIWRGEPSVEAFDALLEKPSAEAGRNGITNESSIVSEGVVIRSNPLLRDVFGDWLIIKHKSKKYREATPRTERKVADLTETGPLDDFTATYVVAGRVINALGRLRDAGVVLQGTMQDMGKVADAIVLDLHKECEPEWQALEAKGFAEKQIRNAVTRTLAGVYRELLASGEA